MGSGCTQEVGMPSLGVPMRRMISILVMAFLVFVLTHWALHALPVALGLLIGPTVFLLGGVVGLALLCGVIDLRNRTGPTVTARYLGSLIDAARAGAHLLDGGGRRLARFVGYWLAIDTNAPYRARPSRPTIIDADLKGA